MTRFCLNVAYLVRPSLLGLIEYAYSPLARREAASIGGLTIFGAVQPDTLALIHFLHRA